jgi:putative membrane protein
MMGWGGLWGWWMFIPALFVLLVIGGGLALIVWLASQGLSRASIPPTGRDAALEALRLRYARGEITKEQFDQIRADLEKD